MKKIVTVLAVTGSVLVSGLALAATPASAGSACTLDRAKVDYPRGAKAARRQNAQYCRHRLINADGALTDKGVAWNGLRKGATPAARTAEQVDRQLSAYRDLGLYDPRKVEYMDDPKVALRQFKTWCEKGWIRPDGGWSKKGRARYFRD